MRFTLTDHAKLEMDRRGIPASVVEHVLNDPEQVVMQDEELNVYQSVVDLDGRMWLIRVVVNDKVDPAVVVTVYRTARIRSYWRAG
jgi:hypothetical protein